MITDDRYNPCGVSNGVFENETRSKRSPHPVSAVRPLEKKYEEALGAKKALQEAQYEWQGFNGFEMAEEEYLKRLKRIDLRLVSLEETIRIFDPEWNRKRLMVPRILRPSPRLPKGSIKPALVRVLREAGCAAQTVKEIAEKVAALLCLPTRFYDDRVRNRNAVSSALNSAHKEGFVERLDCHPVKWRIASFSQ